MLRQVMILIGAVAVAAAAGPASAQERCGPVGAASIHGCLYSGPEPTIVLAAGAGQDSRTWAPLIEDLAALGTIVSFDRPGLGQSPDAEGPRTPTSIARELRDLLASLGVSGPVLLVGHSMGGIHVLRYADLYPGSVAGVVLLDTPPPGFERERMSLLSAQERELRRGQLAEGRTRAPDIVGRERDGAALEPQEFDGPPATMPLFVVVADSQYFGDLGSPSAHRSLWMSLSEQWLDLSTRSELIIAEGSGHMVHHDRPGLVLDVIRRLVEVSRSGRPGRRSTEASH